MSSVGDYSLTLVTPPAVEPVTLEAVKKHCRISHDDDDDLFTIWVTAARQLIETETNCRLIEQTWRLSLKDWPSDCGWIELPLQPVISVETLKYLDSNSTLQTLVVDTDYLLDIGRKPSVIYSTPGTYFPAAKAGRTDSVRVEFTVGYGDEAADVPELAKAAILLTVGYWDANRGDEEDPTKFGLPPGAIRLLNLLDIRGYR